MIYERPGEYYSDKFLQEKYRVQPLTSDELDELETKDMTNEQRTMFWAWRRQHPHS